MHPRVLPFEGASNFRDLGGYAGAGGRTLRWRRIFRSDHLGGLTEADRAALRALGVTRAFDFRGVHESSVQPYALDGLQRHALSIEPAIVQQLEAMATLGQQADAPRMTELMVELYRRLVDEQHHRFAEFFELLLAAEDPVVFHCTAGKDRTGVAAALLLRALGVAADVVERDYLLTNDVYRRPALARRPGRRLADEALAVLWSVDRRFLAAAFEAIETRHGGLEHYFAQRLGLTPPRRALLAAGLLEPAAPAG